MNKQQKIAVVSLWGLLAVAMVAIVASGMWGRPRAPDEDEPHSPAEPVPIGTFALIDQDGRPFSNNDLAGRVWIADFIFTRCPGPCPTMTRTMATLQEPLAGSEVRLVSFSLDGEYDTPEVLKAYARDYGADPARWTMLTGPKQTIHGLARRMFIGVTPERGGQPMTHGTHFVLIDGQGRLRGHYRSTDAAHLRRLVADAIALSRQEGRP